MSLAGNTSPRRLHRLTSFSIVTAFARSVTGSAAFSADKQHPPAVSIFVNGQFGNSSLMCCPIKNLANYRSLPNAHACHSTRVSHGESQILGRQPAGILREARGRMTVCRRRYLQDTALAWLFQCDYLGGHAAVRLDFENRDRPRDVDQIARQRRTPWIYHQRLAEADRKSVV